MAEKNIATALEELAARVGEEVADVKTEIPTDYIDLSNSSSTTIGSTTTPVYLDAGTITPCSTTIDDVLEADQTVSGSSQSTNTVRFKNYYRYEQTGVASGTYTVEDLLQELVDESHSHTTSSSITYYNCDCDCDCGNNGQCD